MGAAKPAVALRGGRVVRYARHDDLRTALDAARLGVADEVRVEGRSGAAGLHA